MTGPAVDAPMAARRVQVREETILGHRGHQLAATRWQPADRTVRGPAVIMLHGGGQSRLSWSRAGVPLAEAGFEILAVDTRGHGDSDWAPDGDYSVETMASDLESIVGTFDRQVTLVGASLGGIVSMLAGARIPERVASILLVDIVPSFDREGGQRVKAFMQSGIDGFDTLEQVAEAVAHYLPHRTHKPSPDRLSRRLRKRADGRWYWAWDPAVIFGRERPADELEEAMVRAAQQLRGIPMVLLHGAESDVVRSEGIESFLRQVPWLQVTTVADATHTAAGDDNDAFVSTVLTLLTEGSAHAAQ